jgi:uncharacterized membrane protein
MDCRWIIKRNCSAGPKQLAMVFASIVLISFLFGVGFAAFGLWLVLPFVGLELLAVAAAFLVYGRHAADFERIELVDGRLTVESHVGNGASRWEAAALSVRVHVDARGEGWLREVRLVLSSRGSEIEIGRHLPTARRQALGRELRDALRAQPA